MPALIYAVVWIVSLFLYVLSLGNRRISAYLSLPVIFACFVSAGLRGDLFPDTIEYYKIFDEISAVTPFQSEFYSIHGEVGFKLLTALLLWVLGDPAAAMTVYALISFSLLVIISRQNDLNVCAVWLVYYSSSFLLKDLAQIRNSVASLLVVFAVLSTSQVAIFSRLLAASFFFQYGAIGAYLFKLVKRWEQFVIFAALAALLSLVLHFETILAIFGDVGYLRQYADTNYIDPAQHNAVPAIARTLLLLGAATSLAYGIREERQYLRLRSAIFCAAIFYIGFSSVPILSQRLGGYLLGADAFMCAILLKSKRKFLAAVWLIVYALGIFAFNLYSRPFLHEEYRSIL